MYLGTLFRDRHHNIMQGNGDMRVDTNLGQFFNLWHNWKIDQPYANT